MNVSARTVEWKFSIKLIDSIRDIQRSLGAPSFYSVSIMTDKRDYYEVLGVSKDATEKDLKNLFDKSLWGKLHIQIILYGRQFCTARGCDGTICFMCTELFPKRKKKVITNKA